MLFALLYSCSLPVYQNYSLEQQMSESEGFFGYRMCFLMLKVQHKELRLKELSDTVEIRESGEC